MQRHTDLLEDYIVREGEISRAFLTTMEAQSKFHGADTGNGCKKRNVRS
jgi:hypothetical protein